MTDDGARASQLIHKVRWFVDPDDFHGRMRADPGWAAAVRFVCEHGIPLSVFYGRAVEPGEPLWLPADTEVAIGFEQWVSQICGGCGLHRLDWPVEDSETWKGKIDTCFGCVELSDTKKTIPKSVSDARRQAMRIYLVPRPEPEKLLLLAHERGEIELDQLPDFT